MHCPPFPAEMSHFDKQDVLDLRSKYEYAYTLYDYYLIGQGYFQQIPLLVALRVA